MRILLIHQYFLDKIEGGGSRWNEMTKVWGEQGHQIEVIAGMVHYSKGQKSEKYKGKFYFREQFYPNVAINRTHVSEAYNSNFIGRLWAYFSFVFSSIWAGIFKVKGKFDLIVVTSPPLFVGITAYILSKIKAVPFVFEIRDLWPESAIDTGVLQNKAIIKFAYWFEKYIYNKALLINVLTPAFREKLIAEKHVHANKIVFIPNAADFSLSDDLLRNFDIAGFKKLHHLENKFIITYVGAHGVANHLIQILQTAQRLADTSVLFLLIGDGMQKKELLAYATENKIENVKFIDSVSKQEVFKYILASNMGMSVLAKNDTFKTVYSNKSFDYMACKKPILMAIDGVSKNLVEEANAGVFVEPENPIDFESKIRFYLNNKEMINIQGENGYQYAKRNFDREVLAKKYIKILNENV